jgi:hypothetical protein
MVDSIRPRIVSNRPQSLAWLAFWVAEEQTSAAQFHNSTRGQRSASSDVVKHLSVQVGSSLPAVRLLERSSFEFPEGVRKTEVEEGKSCKAISCGGFWLGLRDAFILPCNQGRRL